MGDSEVKRLAGEAVAGDYACLWPLIDRLKETGDDRWLKVVDIIGSAERSGKSSPPNMPLAISEAKRARNRLRDLFWPELAEGGPLALLERLARLAREPEPPTASGTYGSQSVRINPIYSDDAYGGIVGHVLSGQAVAMDAQGRIVPVPPRAECPDCHGERGRWDDNTLWERCRRCGGFGSVATDAGT